MTAGQLGRFVTLGLVWGMSYPFVSVALSSFTPAQIAIGRMALGLLALAVVVAAVRPRLPREPRTWLHLAVSSTVGMVVPFLLIGYGQQRSGAATAGVIIAALPLITVMLSALVLPQERADRTTVVSFLAAFGGVVLVIGPWRVELTALVGALAVVGAATTYAMETVYIRRFLVPRRLPPVVMAAGQLVTALAIQSCLVPATGWPVVVPTAGAVAAMLVLGLVGTGFAFVLFNRLIAEVGANAAASVNYLVPVVSAVGAMLLLGESLSWNLLAGGGVVLGALAVGQAWPRRGRPVVSRPAPVEAQALPCGACP